MSETEAAGNSGALNPNSRLFLQKQVCDDVERRLKVFEEMWRNGKLSLPVKCRMHGLSQGESFCP